jgi:hypothetical protein
MSTLVIVPCGKGKVWDRQPHHGAAPAIEAYTGSMFRLNRQYAEEFGDAWVILSAKYGFVVPDFIIPEPYNVTFRLPATLPATADQLQRQVHAQGLDRYRDVIGLGGKFYRAAIASAFAGSSVHLQFPFAGLPNGNLMQAIKAAVVAERSK